LAILALAGAAMAQGTYTIDGSHSSAQFSVKHMMISNVRGEFTGVAGTVTYDPKDPAASKIDATMDVNSINTRSRSGTHT
jgi:polyisoprenoid-binding protein YceI